MPEYIQPSELRSIRRHALENAVRAREAGIIEGFVTEWARTFETYILTGKTFAEQQEEKENG